MLAFPHLTLRTLRTLLLAWLLSGWALSQEFQTPADAERGRPVTDVYPGSLDGSGADHARVQILPDDRLAVANSAGLLLFDGIRWQLARHPERRAPLIELAYTPDGRFYGGFPDDIGYFSADASGVFHWTSLQARLAPQARNFGVVIAALYCARLDAIIYVAGGAAMVLARGSEAPAATLQPTGAFTSARIVDGEVWLHDSRAGLLRMNASGGVARLPSLTPILRTQALAGTPAGIASTTSGQLVMTSIFLGGVIAYRALAAMGPQKI